MLCGLSFSGVLHRVLVHAGVSRQQADVVLLTVVADGSPVTERLLEGGEKEKCLSNNGLHHYKENTFGLRKLTKFK